MFRCWRPAACCRRPTRPPSRTRSSPSLPAPVRPAITANWPPAVSTWRPFTKPESITENREGWERILEQASARARCRPRAFRGRHALDAADPVRAGRVRQGRPQRQARSRPRHRAPPEPQRVHQHHPRPAGASTSAPRRTFPPTISGYGFDNIGDVLTISPVLMEKYLAAAETHRRRAPSAPTRCPRSRIEVQYHAKDKTHPPPRSEHHRSHASHRFRRRVHRPLRPARRARGRCQAGDAGLLDGWQAARRPCRSRPSLPGWSTSIRTPTSRCALYLPEGDHVFRAGFIDDDFVKDARRQGRSTTARRTSYLDSITFIGPFPSKVEKASRKKILICDPQSGAGLRREDPHQPGAPRLSPAGDHGRSGVADEVRGAWRKPTGSPPSRASNWRIAGDAGLAATSCSASSTTPTRPIRPRSTRSPTSNWPRG